MARAHSALMLSEHGRNLFSTYNLPAKFRPVTNWAVGPLALASVLPQSITNPSSSHQSPLAPPLTSIGVRERGLAARVVSGFSHTKQRPRQPRRPNTDTNPNPDIYPHSEQHLCVCRRLPIKTSILILRACISPRSSSSAKPIRKVVISAVSYKRG